MGKRFMVGALFGLMLGAAFSWAAGLPLVTKSAATPISATLQATCMSDGNINVKLIPRQ